MRPCLSRNNRNHLLIEGIDTVDLCERFGTPLFIICEHHLRESFKHFRDTFIKHYNKTIVAYSYKTNYLPAICAILNDGGAWSEVVSTLELSIASKIQVDPPKIIFNGPCKTDDELLEALRLDVGIINVDSLSELARLGYLAQKTGFVANVGVRLLPPSERETTRSKFGLDTKNALKACKFISQNQNMKFIGLHAHLGTQIASIKPYTMMIRYMINFASILRSKLGLETMFLDIGGGFPSSLKPFYATKDPWPPPSVKEYASTICSTLIHEAKQNRIELPYLVLEPGRAIVSSSTYLLTKMVAIKSIPQVGKWVIIDYDLNLLPEAEYFCHRALPSVVRKGKKENVHIGGPLCMYEDIIGLNRRLSPLREGDVLTISDAGAYSVSLSWQFMKPRPSVCLIHKGGVELIRKAETIEDILKLDIIPQHMMST